MVVFRHKNVDQLLITVSQTTPAPSDGPQLCLFKWGQELRVVSEPLHITSS